MGYRRKKHHRRRKHTLPMQNTWPAVAKNMPSHQDRRKKHPPPLQKTPPTGTVAKNTKTSHRRKKHELPTQKTRNPKFFYPKKPGRKRVFRRPRQFHAAVQSGNHDVAAWRALSRTAVQSLRHFKVPGGWHTLEMKVVL